jgi:hypothetical protein
MQLTCAVLIGVSAAGLAFAGPAIDWDPIFTWEPGATAYNSPVGGVLQGVGLVSKFDTPFADLNASDPTREYTIYIYGLVSQGTTTQSIGSMSVYTTNYVGGNIEIYEDLTPDASYDPNPPNAGVPGDFTDGTLILSGQFTTVHTTTNNFTTYNTGNMEGNINWTGGTLYSRTFNGNGRPCPGLFTGGLTWYPPVMIPGYVFRHDGKIDLDCPTPTVPSTWGELKGSYR